MYNIQFRNINTIINIPSVKIESKEVYQDIAGGNGTILVDENFENFTLQIYKSTIRGKTRIDNYDREAIEYDNKKNIFDYWLLIKRRGNNKG